MKRHDSVNESCSLVTRRSLSSTPMSVEKEEVIFDFFRLFRLFNFFQLFLKLKKIENKLMEEEATAKDAEAAVA